MAESPTFRVTLELLEDFVFKIDFDEYGYILTDEPPPLGTGEGPNPARLVAAAVGNCLSASLIFALKKKKQEPGTIRAEAEGTLHRIDGFWRIEKIDVTITVDNKEVDKAVLEDALGVFEDYCIVTQSIRDGIPISLEVRDTDGNQLK